MDQENINDNVDDDDNKNEHNGPLFIVLSNHYCVFSSSILFSAVQARTQQFSRIVEYHIPLYKFIVHLGNKNVLIICVFND